MKKWNKWVGRFNSLPDCHIQGMRQVRGHHKTANREKERVREMEVKREIGRDKERDKRKIKEGEGNAA